jgi:hypothetical protein
MSLLKEEFLYLPNSEMTVGQSVQFISLHEMSWVTQRKPMPSAMWSFDCTLMWC